MFTGLIETVGKLAAVRERKGTKRITIAAPAIASQLRSGDSVAVNGVCLTALDIDRRSFSADLAEETLARTSLTALKKGTPMNLELAMPANSDRRFGGHIVQGHVDGVGRLVGLQRIKGRKDYSLEIDLPAGLSRYVVEKGSVAVEGISLTVAAIKGSRVRIAIIPHTYSHTNLRTKRAGDPLNIEVDILGKYAEKLLAGDTQEGSLTIEGLIAQGF